ncbi:MAG: hypothetical protein K6C94_04450 [Candidatus Gastranaerophilales bacterium]|nr:hypothetical protein [Candidatus Gastranaerophilales bacterium]
MLKKCLISMIILLVSSACAFADKIPSSSKSVKHYGIGLLKINDDFDVYDKPHADAKIIRHFILPAAKSAIVQDSRKGANPYIVSIPAQRQFFAAIYEYPEKNWVQIYYNQNGKEVGWVKMPEKSDFLTWKEFVYKYGKKNGIVLMKDVPTSQYKLYAQDNESAQVVDEFTYPEYIALRMIRGNWALVTVVDTGTVYKTGWFRWRTDDGKLRVFPKMKQK